MIADVVSPAASWHILCDGCCSVLNTGCCDTAPLLMCASQQQICVVEEALACRTLLLLVIQSTFGFTFASLGTDPAHIPWRAAQRTMPARACRLPLTAILRFLLNGHNRGLVNYEFVLHALLYYRRLLAATPGEHPHCMLLCGSQTWRATVPRGWIRG
jgi:hypothetical protein